MKNAKFMAMVAILVSLVGCKALLDKVAELAGLAGISLVGVYPSPGYADSSSPDHGKFFVALSAESEEGQFIAPALDFLEVKNGNGEPLTVEGSEEREGNDKGSMFVLVDASGSMGVTDPERYRVEAVKMLADQLNECGDGWRMTLFQFSGSGPTEITAWTDNLSQIQNDADGLGAGGGTDLFDSIVFAVDSIGTDVESSFTNTSDVGTSLVVISDGMDYASINRFEDVLAKAKSAGVPVHTIGLGPASDRAPEPDEADDTGNPWGEYLGTDPALVKMLQELSDSSGGVYGAAGSADHLPDVTEAIAQAHCGGYSLLVIKDDNPSGKGEEVNGSVGVKGTDLAAPYTFFAPQ